MKGKKFYLILFGLIVIGIGSVYLYRQQQEARFLEFEGYEISTIENRVNALYNQDKTDLADDITEAELEDLGLVLSELQEKDLGRQNKNRIEAMQDDFLNVQDMLVLEEDISQLFIEEGVVDKNTTVEEVEGLEGDVLTYEDISLYYERNMTHLDEAKIQIEAIETATEFVENLFSDEEVLEEVTREDEEEAYELIEKVKNEEIRENLNNRMEVVNSALTEREDLLAEEEALAEAELEAEMEEEAEIEAETELETEPEEVEEPMTTAPNPTENTGSSNSSNSSQSSGSSGSTNSGNTSGSSGSTNNSSNSSQDASGSGSSEPAITVVRTYNETEEIELPYEVIPVDNPAKDAGHESVLEQGVRGTRVVTFEVTEYSDGSRDRERTSSVVQKPPKHEIVEVGTRQPTPDSEDE